MEMHFLSDVYVTCDTCGSRRYNRETLNVKYKEKSIADVLDMNVAEAFEFFKHEVSGETPVVALVGPHDETAGVDAVRRGAKEYIVKGQVNSKLLVSVLRYAINLHHTEETLRSVFDLRDEDPADQPV